jgi:hypothetical protein
VNLDCRVPVLLAGNAGTILYMKSLLITAVSTCPPTIPYGLTRTENLILNTYYPEVIDWVEGGRTEEATSNRERLVAQTFSGDDLLFNEKEDKDDKYSETHLLRINEHVQRGIVFGAHSSGHGTGANG